jgi:hypothetical protein
MCNGMTPLVLGLHTRHVKMGPTAGPIAEPSFALRLGPYMAISHHSSDSDAACSCALLLAHAASGPFGDSPRERSWAQHLTLFISACLCWVAVSGTDEARAKLLVMSLRPSPISAYLVLSSYFVPPFAGACHTRWFFARLEQRQLGGLIMLVPAAWWYDRRLWARGVG